MSHHAAGQRYKGHTDMPKNWYMAHEDSKWIAGAIKHPGALHKQLGVKQGAKIPASTLAAAAQKPGVLGRRARLAQTLRRLHKG